MPYTVSTPKVQKIKLHTKHYSITIIASLQTIFFIAVTMSTALL